MKIVVTLESAVQVGPDDYQMQRISRVYDTSRPIDDMPSWAKAEGFHNPTINDLRFSDYTGESI